MEEKPDTLTALCPECGEIIEVADPRTLLITLHQVNACSEVRSLVSKEPE